jgi:hypothetical protein
MQRFRSFALAAALFTSAAWGAECDNWQTAHPEWLWCDDFEATTSLSQRYEDVSTDGMSVVAANGFNGSKGLTQAYTSGQVNAGWVTKSKSTGFPDHIFYRYYHKFGSGYTRFPPKMSRIGYRNFSNWSAVYHVHSWLTDSGTMTADVLASNSTQTNGTGWLQLASANYSFSGHANEWVAVETEVKVNTPGQKDGLYRTWINGTLVIERLNVDLRGSTSDKINEVMLDCYWNGGSTGNLTRYYDNFVISTTKIGLAGTATLAPPMPPTNVTVDQTN